MTHDKTPQDLTITPRDRRFGRGTTQQRWWMGGDPIATAFYNALSITFPKGEAFFVDSVRSFREGVPPKLEQEINAFIKQEVMHSREHVSFNKRVSDAGYEIAALEEVVTQSLELTKNRPAILNLAVTMALEHYTAILAADFLGNPKLLAGADKEWGDLWRWHAIEEIEHKGVAYDTWLHATRDWSRFKRWRIKALVMLIVTGRFFNGRRKGVLDLLRQDGLTGPRVWGRLAWYVLAKPGMMRKILGAWIAFFLPGFHPWNEDDRALIGKADSEFADARMALSA